jgi:hypothetical protein
MVGERVGPPFRWARVNAEPFEYLIGKGRFGDEFVKLEDGTCVRIPAEPLPPVTEEADAETTD